MITTALPVLSEPTNHEQRTTNPDVCCRNCGIIYDPADTPGKPECLGCGEQICIRCGCTDHTACFEGLDEGTCYWLRPGICSACPDNEPRTRNQHA